MHALKMIKNMHQYIQLQVIVIIVMYAKQQVINVNNLLDLNEQHNLQSYKYKHLIIKIKNQTFEINILIFQYYCLIKMLYSIMLLLKDLQMHQLYINPIIQILNL